MYVVIANPVHDGSMMMNVNHVNLFQIYGVQLLHPDIPSRIRYCLRYKDVAL